MRTGLGLGVTYDVGAEFLSSYSLSFDGNKGYVSVGDHSSLDITDAITLSAWINAENLDSVWNVVVGKFGSDGGKYPYVLMIKKSDGDNPPKIALSINNSTKYADTTITTGSWIHIAGTYDKDAGGSDEIKLYLNGNLDGDGDYSNPIDTNDDALEIGRYGFSSGGGYFNGKIDEVALWDAALSEKDIKGIYNNGMPNNLLLPGVYATDRTSNLKGWWRFEEGSGTSVADSSGNGNTGTSSFPSSGGGKQLPI